VVITEDEIVENVIFIKSGKLRIDKEITLDHTNYWPVGYKHWEVSTTKKT
jgi:hypothetical protein